VGQTAKTFGTVLQGLQNNISKFDFRILLTWRPLRCYSGHALRPFVRVYPESFDSAQDRLRRRAQGMLCARYKNERLKFLSDRKNLSEILILVFLFELLEISVGQKFPTRIISTNSKENANVLFSLQLDDVYFYWHTRC
jgi:hypothetical protein